MPSSHYLVTSPVPIKAPGDVSHMIKDKHHHLWKAVMHDQHVNNHKLLALYVPFPIKDIPKDKKILRPVLVSTVKTRSSETEICYLCLRLCANGSDQTADLE